MIGTSIQDRILTITLKGEDDLNLGALDDGLYDAVDQYLLDNELWCCIITGEGTRAFCAGADLKQVASKGLSSQFWPSGRETFLTRRSFEKPLIAAVNGHAIGAGMMIALACDIRIASENATFALPEVKFGFPPMLGATQRLARALPQAVALQMIMTGASITAKQAQTWGLTTETLPVGELMGRAEEIGRQIVANPPAAVRACKELVRLSGDDGLHEGIRMERAFSFLARETADSKESLRAYLERRQPKLSGY